MAAAYVVGHVTVKDSAKWTQYRSQVPATLTEWGAELLLRGKLHAVLGGSHERSDVVVLRFPSVEAATRWHDSPAYQALIPHAPRSRRGRPDPLRGLELNYAPRGRSSMAERQLPKLHTRVRFPSPAPDIVSGGPSRAFFLVCFLCTLRALARAHCWSRS
jgi:uncharacterized protein (DUF1330 family)